MIETPFMTVSELVGFGALFYILLSESSIFDNTENKE
tara:strand:- start:185 stop:295 length:111 start_codon:yes stop_codon:yes gene_type:complete